MAVSKFFSKLSLKKQPRKFALVPDDVLELIVLNLELYEIVRLRGVSPRFKNVADEAVAKIKSVDLGKTVQLFKRNSRKRADLAEAPRPMVEKVVQIVINQCHESLEEIKFGLNCLYSDCFKVLQKCDNLKSIGLFSVYANSTSRWGDNNQLEYLTTYLENHPGVVEKVQLRANPKDQANGWQIPAKIIDCISQNCPKLRALTLHFAHYSVVQRTENRKVLVEAILNALRMSSATLEELDISCFTSFVLGVCLSHSLTLSKLSRLSLIGEEIGSSDCMFALFLEKNPDIILVDAPAIGILAPNLKYFTLAFDEFVGDQGVIDLLPSIQNIEELRIMNCNLTDRSVLAMCQPGLLPKLRTLFLKEDAAQKRGYSARMRIESALKKARPALGIRTLRVNRRPVPIDNNNSWISLVTETQFD